MITINTNNVHAVHPLFSEIAQYSTDNIAYIVGKANFKKIDSGKLGHKNIG